MTDIIDAGVFESLCAPVPALEFLDLLRRTGFCAAAYRDAYGDLAGRNWGEQQLISHLFRHGLDERRSAPMTLDRQALVALAQLPMRDAELKAKLLTFLSRHLFDHVDRPDGAAITGRWATVRALSRERGRPYFIAGDSHSFQYALTGTRGGAWLLPIHLLCTGGSAGGLSNPASRSGYGDLLRQATQVILRLPGTHRIPFLLQFGQVDLEFVYHYRRARDGKQKHSQDDYRAFAEATLAQYLEFLTDLVPATHRSHVFLVSVFPPALSDAAWHEGYVNADIAHREAAAPVADLRSAVRGLEVASLRQRTEIHASYNDGLRAASRRLGFGFVGGMTPFLDADGVVDPHFVIPKTGGAEHHLDIRRTYQDIRDLVWDCIDDTSPTRKPVTQPDRSPG